MPEILATAYVRIRPETGDFRGDADRDVRAALEGVTGNVAVGADTDRAKVSIDDIKARLADIRTTRVAVDVDDARAIAAVELLKTDLDRLPDKKRVSVNVDDGGAGLGLLGLAAGLTPALGTIGVAGAGAGAGLAAGFVTAAGAAATFGVVAKTAYSDATAAQQKLADAQTALNKAEQSGSTKQIATALQAYEKALAGINPQQQQFIAQLDATKTAYKDMAGAVTPQVLGVLDSGLKQVTPGLQALPGLVAAVVPSVQGLEDGLGGFLASPAFGKFTAFLETEGPKDLSLIGGAVGHFGQLTVSSLQAIAPLTDRVLGGLDSGLASLNARVEDGGLDRFVATATADLPIVEHALSDVGSALVHLGEDLAPLGPPLLNVVDGLAHVVDEAEPTVKTIVSGLTPALSGLSTVLHVLGPELGPIAADFAALYGATKLLNTIPGVSVSLLGAAKAATTAGAEAETASGKTGLLTKAVGALGLTTPVGAAAVGLLAGGLVAYQINANEAANTTKELNDAIKKITSGEVLDQSNSYDTAAASLQKLSIQTKGMSTSLGGLHVSTGSLFDTSKAIDKFSEAAQTAAGKADAIRTSLADLSATTGLATLQVQRMAQAAGVDLSQPLAQTGQEMQTLALFAGASNTQLSLLGQSFTDLHGPAATAASELKGINELFAAQNVIIGYTQATDHTADALKNLTTVTHTAGVSQESIRTATEGAITALDQQVAQAKAAGKPLSEQNQIYADGYRQIVGLATGTTAAKDATVTLVKNLITPKQFDAQNTGVANATLQLLGYSSAAATAAGNLQSLIDKDNALAKLLAGGLGVPGIPSLPHPNQPVPGLPQPFAAPTRSAGRGLASGGFIDGPFGSPQARLVHGGELVLNPNQQQAVAALMSGSSGGSRPTIHTQLVVQGNVYGDQALIDHVTRLMDERDEQFDRRMVMG